MKCKTREHNWTEVSCRINEKGVHLVTESCRVCGQKIYGERVLTDGCAPVVLHE